MQQVPKVAVGNGGMSDVLCLHQKPFFILLAPSATDRPVLSHMLAQGLRYLRCWGCMGARFASHIVRFELGVHTVRPAIASGVRLCLLHSPRSRDPTFHLTRRLPLG